jgi:hypothetical protein
MSWKPDTATTTMLLIDEENRTEREMRGTMDGDASRTAAVVGRNGSKSD